MINTSTGKNIVRKTSQAGGFKVVGLGGTTRPGSSSEVALRVALQAAEEKGADTTIFTGRELASLPIFDPQIASGTALANQLINALRTADGVIVASPGYHGSVSGLVKNALDYTELMNSDPEPYLSNRSVGLIVTAYGWQAVNSTLNTLRSITHALRGWPTPYGATINSTQANLKSVEEIDERSYNALCLVAADVVSFAERRKLALVQNNLGRLDRIPA